MTGAECNGCLEMSGKRNLLIMSREQGSYRFGSAQSRSVSFVYDELVWQLKLLDEPNDALGLRALEVVDLQHHEQVRRELKERLECEYLLILSLKDGIAAEPKDCYRFRPNRDPESSSCLPLTQSKAISHTCAEPDS